MGRMGGYSGMRLGIISANSMNVWWLFSRRAILESGQFKKKA
jgi:hypothetical protein